MPTTTKTPAARAVAKGGRLVSGGYVTASGTFMRVNGTRMSNAEIRAASGLPALPKPTSGPGSGETRVTTRAPKGQGETVQATKDNLASAAKPLTAEEKELAAQNGIDTTYVGRARELLSKVKGRTYAKIGAGVAGGTGATVAAVEGTSSEGQITDDMTATEIADRLAASPQIVADASANGAGPQAQRLANVGIARTEDAAAIGQAFIESERLKAESKAAAARLKALSAK